jgi:signal transduction histidine kinase
MDLIRDFFAANDTVLYFVYGQVYFILALSIVLSANPRSQLEMARALPLLAAFGFTQALYKWGDVFIPIQASYAAPNVMPYMRLLQLLVLGLSFMFLFAFGLRMLATRIWNPRVIYGLPLAILGIWAIGIAVFWVFDLASRADITASADVLSRYFLALPGGLLAAAGLRRQAHGTIGAMDVPRIVYFMRIAGISLVIYAFLAGLFGPPAPFFPANWLNQVALQDLLGIPVAVFRALVGLVLTYSILRALEVFQVETDHWIEEMERAQALAVDRERIGRELHDGTIQSIYAAGLILEDVRMSLEVEPERAAVQLSRAMTSLNQTIQEIRSYIFDLRRGEDVEDIEASLDRLTRDFRVNTLIEVDFSVEGKRPKPLEPDRARNMYQIAREALTNVARHAQARHVDVRLRYGERQLTLRIADDGIGFPVSGADGAGRGLKNMRERAQLLEGALVVEGTPREGVTVVLTMPI